MTKDLECKCTVHLHEGCRVVWTVPSSFRSHWNCYRSSNTCTYKFNPGISRSATDLYMIGCKTRCIVQLHDSILQDHEQCIGSAERSRCSQERNGNQFRSQPISRTTLKDARRSCSSVVDPRYRDPRPSMPSMPMSRASNSRPLRWLRWPRLNGSESTVGVFQDADMECAKTPNALLPCVND